VSRILIALSLKAVIKPEPTGDEHRALWAMRAEQLSNGSARLFHSQLGD
jgi:hypothetical protein